MLPKLLSLRAGRRNVLPVVTGDSSCFASLAARPPSAAGVCRSVSGRATSPLENRVGGFRRGPSGRPSPRRFRGRASATGCRRRGYKTASGRRQWLNRDPIGEAEGINLYTFVYNNPLGWTYPFGLSIQPPSKPPISIGVPGFPDLTWVSRDRSGKRPKWVPSGPTPGRSPPSLHWDPLGHWDLDNGLGTRTRYDFRGVPISAEKAHANPHRRPKKGPGSFCGIVAGIAAGAATGLDASADNGAFDRIRAAASNGASPEEVDNMVYDAAVDAAIESGNAGTLSGLYGPWYWLRKFFGK